MDMLRAVMAVNEKSERALELTEKILSLNAAHYSVWYDYLIQSFVTDYDFLENRAYRTDILFSINADLNKELDWMEDLMKIHLKSYQVWSVSSHQSFVIA
jgi:protein farnesyltransferase/geranylgeranyltransferase type-1 subunit alpha